MASQPNNGLGNIISGQQLQAPPGPPSTEALAEENLRFLERPEVQAGLLQLGISLLSPGDLGSAFADAAGATGRYQQNERQRGIEDRQLEQQETQHKADIANRYASTAALRGQATESQTRARNIPVVNELRDREVTQGDRRLSQADAGLELERQRVENEQRRINLMEQQYALQAQSSGTGWGEIDKTIFTQAIDHYGKIIEAESNLAGLTGDGTAATGWDPMRFERLHNGLRSSNGLPPITPFAGGLTPSAQPMQGPQSTDPAASAYIIDAATIRQAKAEGASKERLKALLQRFRVTPEALEEIMKDDSR